MYSTSLYTQNNFITPRKNRSINLPERVSDDAIAHVACWCGFYKFVEHHVSYIVSLVSWALPSHLMYNFDLKIIKRRAHKQNFQKKK
jgi:hypothetical protein